MCLSTYDLERIIESEFHYGYRTMEAVSGSSDEVSAVAANRPTGNEEVVVPRYISYLLNPTTKHNIFFLVGDPSLEEPVEKIGAVKLMLQAHSKPLHVMLEESELAEKGVVKITDIQPNTFKHLLGFMYGYNYVPTLTMEEAVDLVYAAEKYLVDELKDKLAAHISSILTVDNVFLALQKPECFQMEELKKAILKIVQHKTKSLLSKDEFLQLNDFGVQTILEQKTLGVPEIDVWRAMVKWAKHNALSYEAVELRGKLEKHLKYIRLCTLAVEDVIKEVKATGILTKDEVFSIIESAVCNTKEEDLVTVCNEIEVRNLVRDFVVSKEYIFSMSSNHSDRMTTSSHIFILTKDYPLLLTSALCTGNSHKWKFASKALEYKCKCMVSVTKITDCITLTSSEPLVYFTFEGLVKCNEQFKIPFRVGEENVMLLPNSIYRIELSFSQNSLLSWCDSTDVNFNDIYLTVVLGNFPQPYNSTIHHSGSHITELAYKIIQDK